MIVQVPVGVGPHDVVYPDRPGTPADAPEVSYPVVGVEQSPAAQVDLSAIS